MAKKLVAVFLMLVVVVAALHIREAEAEDGDHQEYKECFGNCLKECEDGNAHGQTYCEMSCDTECASKESAGKFSSSVFMLSDKCLYRQTVNLEYAYQSISYLIVRTY